VVLLTVVTDEDSPHVPADEKLRVIDLGQGFYRLVARFGFMETPQITAILQLARKRGLDFDVESTSFFVGRETLLPSRQREIPLWRKKLFAFMSRNALGATAFFRIPPERVIEVGAQIEI
jgi:KUP system potassium uptake protein